MKRALLVVCCLGVVPAIAFADDADPVIARASSAERSVLEQLDKEQYIKARDSAEAILDQDPGSFVATWAMARVQHDEEGNHARALYYVRRAESLLAATYGNPPAWDAKILLEEFWIDHEMDRMTDALEVLGRYEARHGKNREWLRIWPTFKLGRMDDARAIGHKLAASDDPWERREAYNGMLSLEFEAHDREAAYTWAMGGVDVTQGKSCNLLRNAAGCAYTRFRLREAEDLGLRAHQAEQKDCEGDGYDQLAGLYLLEGEFQKAVAALQSLKGVPIPKRYRPHYALERRAILADILFALGKVDDGERLAAEVYALPERMGMTSGAKRVGDFTRSFRYWRAVDVKLARDAERAGYGPLFGSLSLDHVGRVFTQWLLRGAVLQLAADDDFLVTLVRPNLGELFEDASWTRMALAEILGIGVIRQAVAAARAADAHYREAGPYLDLDDGELAWRDGDDARAVELATAALRALPKEEALRRWRALAWQADALRRLGRGGEAEPLLHEVLQKFPSVLRILDVAIPVTATSDGSELAAEAASRIGSSPRFDLRANAPFKVTATSKAGVVELCLADTGGFSFACAHGEAKDAVMSALDAFHDAAFSPKVALAQADLNSLDGSPVRQSSDQVLKGILEAVP